MIKEAIDRVIELGQQSIADPKLIETVLHGDKSFDHKVEPTQFGLKVGDVILPFRPAKLEVSTLTGFVDAIKGGVCAGPESLVIHVEDYLTVSVKSATCDDFGVRDTLLTAKHKPLDSFRFDDYYNDPSRFIIAFQVSFLVNDPDGVYLLKLASNLKAGNEVHTADDGINQTVAFKQGEVKTAEHQMKPRLKLMPRRTFDEAAPVESEFLVRLKQTEAQTPAIAIFNVEGTKWQGESMRAIKEYLAKELTGWTILA